LARRNEWGEHPIRFKDRRRIVLVLVPETGPKKSDYEDEDEDEISRRITHRCTVAMGSSPHGRIFPVSSSAAPRKQQEGELGLKESWYPIQVKQKDKAGRPDIDAFEAMMMREDCEKGFFVSFDYSADALSEIESFFKRSHKVIVALTVQEILDEHIAKKLV
jgi:hypothetical protein